MSEQVLDHALGLPVPIEPRETLDSSEWRGATLQNEAEKLMLWIAVGEAAPADGSRKP
jgi:hypothetical protein